MSQMPPMSGEVRIFLWFVGSIAVIGIVLMVWWGICAGWQACLDGAARDLR